jgi:uncharacterized tellurite resistance protein B-like protein
LSEKTQLERPRNSSGQMLAKLRQLFEPVPGGADHRPHAELELAAAVLMVEVARADYENDAAEYRVLEDRLQRRTTLDGAALKQLLHRAEAEVEHSVSLHDYTDLINRNYTPGQKFELLCALWEIAYGDGELHHYEEHLIRRLADLLHVPHREFIRAKFEARKAT